MGGEFQQIVDNELPEGWDSDLPVFETSAKGTASRGSSGKVINAIAKKIPWFMGGSADLAGSTKTLVDGASSFSAGDYTGRNFHFGIREHAMAAACNGMALCGLRPYGATFFVFTDYLRPSLRLSSIMHQPVLYVLTHDSIGLGEDGPTHQPIEHLAACRAIPGLYVMRPGDANEVSECYRTALNTNDHPVAMVLTRQDIPTFDRSRFQPAAGAARGGYILADAADGKPEVILMATGSELAICVEAYEKLTADGVKARVVSLPCFELFDQQDEAYRKQVLPPDVTARVACEAGIEMGWDRYLGQRGKFVGLSTYGASAPYEELYERFGLTPTAIAAAARELL
ncbi:MAG: transketolase C-terminal domain-containing protein [Pirellulales bacterium]